MYIDIYIDSFILTYGIKKNTLSAFANRKKNENMKKIIDYLIDYACPIISDNRLWNFSDCTSLSTVHLHTLYVPLSYGRIVCHLHFIYYMYMQFKNACVNLITGN